ncbi:MAG: hypothetical protein Q9187_003528 [Circinaria calcarea]
MHPLTLKRRVFTVPVLMNIAIILLLLWRARIALPQYGALLLAALGYDSSARIDTASADWISLGKTGARRFLMFFLDWILVAYILPWPFDFFFGSSSRIASPVSWRRAIGFQDQEVIVRISRQWDRSLPKKWPLQEADDTFYQERIMPALDESRRAKTGYLTMDKSWDLDFAGMITAHTLISQSKASFADFRNIVIVYSEEHSWLVWELDRGQREERQEEGRRSIVMFKDRLTAMGKENLFFRWIELVENETSQPGGSTPEKQANLTVKARELFESQGVDYERCWKDVGGIQGLPGMELAS